MKAAFAATRAIIGAYEIDFRIMVGEEVRWVSARGQGSDADIVNRVMYGIFLDVTGRKQAEEGHELLAGENEKSGVGGLGIHHVRRAL